MTKIKLIFFFFLSQTQEDGVCCPVSSQQRVKRLFWTSSIVVSAWHQSKIVLGTKETQETAEIHYNRVGKGVGDNCSFGAYLAKKGKNTVSMTPTMASI